MRYILVTYDEAKLPAPGYDLFENLGGFLEGEGIECGAGEFGRMESVVESVESDVIEEGGSRVQQDMFAIIQQIERGLELLDGVPVVDEGAEAHMQGVVDNLMLARGVAESYMPSPVSSEEETEDRAALTASCLGLTRMPDGEIVRAVHETDVPLKPGDRVRIKEGVESAYYQAGAEGTVCFLRGTCAAQVQFHTGGYERVPGYEGWPTDSWSVPLNRLERVA